MKLTEGLTSFRRCCALAARAAALCAAAPLRAQVMINEIDYDQPGTDTMEFIEIKGPAGTSLAGWSIVLYNGSTPAASSSYLTIDLSTVGTIPADGFVVAGSSPAVPNVDVNVAAGAAGFFQNGSPDGLCLVNNGAVVDIIAYETGATMMVGSNGPATGLTFPDIGVAETGSTLSLQRIPDGGGTWQACVPTPGVANNCNVPGATGGLSLGQAGSPIVCMLQATGPGALTYQIQSMPTNGTLGAPVGNMVTYTPTGAFSGIDCFTFNVTNGAGTSATVTQEVGVQQNSVVITEIMHSPSGIDDQFEYVEVFNNSGAAVTLSTLDVSAANTGVTTTDNLGGAMIPAGAYRIIAPSRGAAQDEVFRCNWRLPADHIIFVPNVTGNDHWENVTTTSRIELFGAAGAASACAGAAGGPPPAAVLLDAVDLRGSGFPVNPPEGQSLEIDTFFLPGAPNHLINTANNDAGLVWRNANDLSDPSNERTAGNCDRGSPGFVPPDDDGANTGAFTPEAECMGACCSGAPDYTTCALATAAGCTALGGVYHGDGSACASVTCGCLTAAAARPPTTALETEHVLLCNVVITSTTDLVNSASFKSFQVQDATGGVTVFSENANIDAILGMVGEGDQVDLAGGTAESTGLFELQGACGGLVLIHDDGAVGVPAPTPTTPADYQNASSTAEGLESKLVRLPCVTFVETGTFAGSANYTASGDGGATLVTVRVSTGQLDLVGMAIPTGAVNLTGIFSQFDTNPPLDGGYELLLRSMADIQTPPLVNIASASPANGFRDVLENTNTALTPQGLGVSCGGGTSCGPISVTFSGEPCPAPSLANISVAVTGGTLPTVTGVTGSGAGPYLITLGVPPPARECITFTFMGTNAGQKLQYQNLPGDTNLNGTTTGQDVLNLVNAINMNIAILAQHDINRNGSITGQDVLRQVQLINGGMGVQPPTGYNGATVAACP